MKKEQNKDTNLFTIGLKVIALNLLTSVILGILGFLFMYVFFVGAGKVAQINPGAIFDYGFITIIIIFMCVIIVHGWLAKKLWGWT